MHGRQYPDTGAAAGAGGACAGGGWDAGGGAGWNEREAPQIPQNFISEVMGEPHAEQTGSTGFAAGSGEAGGAGGSSPVFVPQIPQNFSSGASGAPQDRQSGAAGGGAVTAAGDSSNSDAPQFRAELLRRADTLTAFRTERHRILSREIAPGVLRALLYSRMKRTGGIRVGPAGL